ncbi:alginate biosynthesis protein AlgP [Deinococcus multiflagellatus]|uniref:alginate biosynthesis protein AlgP n=1 Tax=Deinococcus multiflagellatus TaxID=1656887 RepID=UPI001CCC1810|nr:alginate biosynthesis protein AlgP [Deinococcus multiflagellatus]MBZ9712901.1 alginate biosynthesis protein AlgP [Deinococcus multiflagellatus]
MTNESTGGVSKRSLLLLGGLAALALNKDTRRALVHGSRSAWSGTQDTVTGTLAPALLGAAHSAKEVAVHTASTLREEGVPKAGALLSQVAHVAGELVGQAQERALHLAGEAGQATAHVAARGGERAKQVLHVAQAGVGHTVADAQGAGRELLASVHDRVGHVLHEAADGHEARKRRAERTLRQARREALRDLQSGKKALKARQLEKAVAKRMAPLEKQLTRELRLLEKQRQRARRDDKRGSGLGSGVTALVLLGTGAVVLARVPAARQGILNAVEGYSPEAAQSLRQAGRNARNLIGTMWLERIEEEKATPAPGAARPTQAATTGATWGGAVAPDSPAAAKTAAETEKTEAKVTDPNAEAAKAKSDAPKADTKGGKSAGATN